MRAASRWLCPPAAAVAARAAWCRAAPTAAFKANTQSLLHRQPRHARSVVRAQRPDPTRAHPALLAANQRTREANTAHKAVLLSAPLPSPAAVPLQAQPAHTTDTARRVGHAAADRHVVASEADAEQRRQSLESTAVCRHCLHKLHRKVVLTRNLRGPTTRASTHAAHSKRCTLRTASAYSTSLP